MLPLRQPQKPVYVTLYNCSEHRKTWSLMAPKINWIWIYMHIELCTLIFLFTAVTRVAEVDAVVTMVGRWSEVSSELKCISWPGPKWGGAEWRYTTPCGTYSRRYSLSRFGKTSSFTQIDLSHRPGVVVWELTAQAIKYDLKLFNLTFQ